MTRTAARNAATRWRAVTSLAVALAGAGVFSVDPATAAPSLEAVTPLGESDTIRDVALSADGSTVVGTRPLQDQTARVIDNRSFIWTREDGFQQIDRLVPGSPTGPGFRAVDVSGDGFRIVGSLDDFPAVWNRGEAMSTLDLLPGGSAGASVLGISDDGRYAVGTAHDGGFVQRLAQSPDGRTTLVDSPRRVPVRWSVEDGTAIALTTTRGSALDVSNTGVAVGALQLDEGPISSGVTAGFRWDPIRGRQFVPTADPASTRETVSSGASGISADGVTIVGHTTGSPPPGSSTTETATRAYLWAGDPGEGDLLPGNGSSLIDTATTGPFTSAAATAVSADGSTVVGGYLRWDFDQPHLVGTYAPFIWTRDGGFQDLTVLLNALGVSNEAWELFEAIDVSADGKTIIGTGQSRAGSEPLARFVWIAVIPEPSTALLLGTGLSILAGQARRQRAGNPREQALRPPPVAKGIGHRSVESTAIDDRGLPSIGDRATFRAHVRVEHRAPAEVAAGGPICWLIVGFYDDVAVRAPAGWRLRSVTPARTYQENEKLLAASMAAGA